MRKVLIWGSGRDYNQLFNLIKCEEAKKEIEIVGIVSKDKWQKKLDGVEVLKPDDIVRTSIAFDYIIVASSRYYSQILEDALSRGIERNKIIHGRVFYTPYFDFGDYAALREFPVSIITLSCMGGFLYHYLDLAFSSPFINTLMDFDDFVRLSGNLRYYLDCPLVEEREGSIVQCPVGTLGEGKEKVRIQFVHGYDFSHSKKEFEKRSKRINWDNLFFTSYSNDIEEVERFENIPYQKKICISELIKLEGMYPSIHIFTGCEAAFQSRSIGFSVNLLRNFVDYYNNIDNLVNECNVFKLLLTGKFEKRIVV